MKNNLIALKQLDQQLSGLKGQTRPAEGWARTLRKALGLTIKQFAKRLGVGPSRVVKIETSELDGAITLHSLQTVAAALDCHLVYSFVPNSSLEATIKARAKSIALAQVKHSSHTMDLEAQSVSQEWLDNQINELTQELLQRSWKYLWEKP